MGTPAKSVDAERGEPLEGTSQPSDPTQIREALAAVFLSAAFRASKQSQHLLQYLVEQTLAGHPDLLKERIVGARVFGRDPDYDTGADPIVRVRAADLRKRLAQYYNGEGAASPVKIEIHPGSYHPVFLSESQPPAAGSANMEPGDWAARLASDSGPARGTTPTADTPGVSEDPHIAPAHETSRPSRRLAVERLAFSTVILVLATLCFAMWTHIRDMNRTLRPWKFQPAVAGFWSVFLNGQKNTDIVLSDSSFSLVEDISNEIFTLNDYLYHDYMSRLRDRTPEMIANLTMIANRNLGATGELKLTQRILALDKLNSNLHVYNAREYTPELIKQDNVILVGSRISNPWDELFEDRMNFDFTFHEDKGIVNRAPIAGEQKNYTWNGSVGYCLVAYLPNPEHNGDALLIQGSSSETTQAAADFLLSENQLANFAKMLHVDKLPYFEVLLKVSWVNEAPITTKIVAYRTYPNMH